jgi:hypothetical protein
MQHFNPNLIAVLAPFTPQLMHFCCVNFPLPVLLRFTFSRIGKAAFLTAYACVFQLIASSLTNVMYMHQDLCSITNI